MSFDSSGTYTPPAPAYPAVGGTAIKAADSNTIVADLATALSMCLLRDGRAAMSGALNMGTHKIRGLSAGTTNGDAVRYEQLTAVATAAITALAALTPAADKFPYFTSASAADQLTIVAAIRTVLASPDVATMRSNMGLLGAAICAVGTGAGDVAAGNHTHTGVYQPSDAKLTAIAGLTSAADGFPYFTGSGTASLLTIVPAVRTVLASADVTAMRTALGLAIGSDVQAYNANLVKKNEVNGYTKQNYAIPADVSGVTGGVTINADDHQDYDGTLTGNSTFGAPSNTAKGKMMFWTLYGASAFTIAFNSVYKRSKNNALPTSLTAGKRMYLNWRCYDGTNWILLGKDEDN